MLKSKWIERIEKTDIIDERGYIYKITAHCDGTEPLLDIPAMIVVMQEANITISDIQNASVYGFTLESEITNAWIRVGELIQKGFEWFNYYNTGEENIGDPERMVS